MKKFKANDNKSEEHEINYRQFNKKLELLNQILSLISDINQASDEKEVKDCIPALLQYTGEYTDADRVYIFELMSENRIITAIPSNGAERGSSPRLTI